jgi:hypothetical protein
MKAVVGDQQQGDVRRARAQLRLEVREEEAAQSVCFQK